MTGGLTVTIRGICVGDQHATQFRGQMLVQSALVF